MRTHRFRIDPSNRVPAGGGNLVRYFFVLHQLVQLANKNMQRDTHGISVTKQASRFGINPSGLPLSLCLPTFFIDWRRNRD